MLQLASVALLAWSHASAPACAARNALVRHTSPRCEDEPTLPDAAMKEIPPEMLAKAWQREEQAKQLTEKLEGCSLYIVGFGPRRAAIGRLLSRRLARYRFYDVEELMCSTYAQLAGADSPPSLGELCEKEPLSDVAQLSAAVMGQVCATTRSVVLAWEGATAQSDYARMQQGIVVCLSSPAESATADLSASDLDAWTAGHKLADASITLDPDAPADDVASEVIEAVAAFVAANPSKAKQGGPPS